MSPPKLLDLYGGAGGAGEGYRRAGFEVTSVDIEPQPRCPSTFVQSDAITYLLEHGHDFAVIHASPPCQAYTPLGALHRHIIYPDLIAATRAALNLVGKPWVMENVMSAPLLSGVILCGGMFNLRTYRHRRFESSAGLELTAPPHPKHVIRTATKQRRERWEQGWHVSVTGDVGVYVGPEAMGIDWMNGNELSQAVPPAYTEFLGRQLIDQLIPLESS